ncbi:Uncharacterised protein [marine metagenome]
MRRLQTDETHSRIFGAITDVPKTYRKILTRLATWLPDPFATCDVVMVGALASGGIVLDPTRRRLHNR